MISLILESYLSLFILVGTGAIIFFVVGAYFIFQNKKQASPNLSVIASSKQVPVTVQDISAIAGDDMIATQLDLARAYIEAGNAKMAKKILEDVLINGNELQKMEARQLTGTA